jgi:hypothetical protein
MKRRDFLRKLGITTGAVAVVPTVLADVPKSQPQIEDELGVLTYLPKGNKIHDFYYSDIEAPEISIDIETKRILVGRFNNFSKTPRVRIQYIYKRVQEIFDESYYFDLETPMIALTPTLYVLKDGWDFFANKSRICGGSWEYEGTDLAYVSTYGLGYLNEPDYVQIKYNGGYIYSDSLPGGMREFHPLLGGVTDRKNDTFLFDEPIFINRKENCNIMFGVFDSYGEMLDVFSINLNPIQRAAIPFCINYPITKWNRKCVREKYDRILNSERTW